MSWLLDIGLAVHNWRHGVPTKKRTLQKSADALRIGVLSAAAINPAAIIDPIQTHPGATLVAIAARDQSRAQAQIDAHKLGPTCRAYGSYAELLQDPNVQAVYIPLPNGLHAAWAIEAMHAGKHVLIEKPITANAHEARRVQQVAQQTSRIALEAFHWRFHPAAHAVRALVASGTHGAPRALRVRMALPGGSLRRDDIRFRYELAGGAAMDLIYVFSAATFLGAGAEFARCAFDVHAAMPRRSGFDEKVDEAMDAEFTIRRAAAGAEGSDVRCRVSADLNVAPLWGFVPRLWATGAVVEIELERATVVFDGFPLAGFWHSIGVTEKASGKRTAEKCYAGGPWWKARGEAWWTTYRYQLEAFVDAVRAKEAGREYEGPWVSLDESVKLMELVDAVYDKTDLPRRGVK